MHHVPLYQYITIFLCVLGNIPQGNRINIREWGRCMWEERESLKNWLTWLRGLGNQNSAGEAEGWRSREELILQLKSKDWKQKPFFLEDLSHFCLKALNWLDEAHPPYKSALLKVYWFKYSSHLKAKCRLVFDLTFGHHSLVKLIYKIIHPTYLLAAW